MWHLARWASLVLVGLGLALAVTILPEASSAQGREPGASTQAAAASGARLTLDTIARDTDAWIGSSPSQIQWSEDGESIYFRWNPDADELSDLYVVPRAGGEPTLVPADRRRLIPTPTGQYNATRSLKVYEAYGDIFLYASDDGSVRRLTDTEATERSPRFAAGDTAVTFEREQNLFLVSLDTGSVRQLTNFRPGDDPDQAAPQTALQEYLEAQQLELFDYLRKVDRLEAERRSREVAERGPRVDPYYLGASRRVSDLELSPDGRVVTFILADRSEAEKGQIVDMPRYVTESGFVEMEHLGGGGGTGRVKAGEPGGDYRLGILALGDGSITWVDHGLGERAVSFNAPVWSDAGDRVMAWVGAVDHKDAWLMLLDIDRGTARTLVHEHDSAWVRGFRTGRLSGGDGIAYGWMPDGDRVYFLSERDGHYHLYVSSLEGGGEARQLTSGRFGLVDLRMSADQQTWYFVSNEIHPAENQLYAMPLEGGARTRLTPRSGWYTYELSPDERHIALTYSDPSHPAELFVMENRAGEEPRQLTQSRKSEFARHAWPHSEIVSFDDGEGHTIYADVWEPENPHPSRPAIIRVHGSGWAQAVYRRWSNVLPFLHYLVQQGYVVMNLDYRGSRGYGRDFRTGIYRHMGETEVQSALAAVEYLVEHRGVDRRRIGLFGGSYGGFFTLMAMFKHPGVFAAGAVRAPVTDWAHYNHGYTTRILNAPYDDSEAYARSSPIYLAEGLRDHLLIQHGVQDNNVHFQDSVRLAQRLLELEKDNWEIMIYPIEAHSLQAEAYNRLDVMRRRARLFDRVLKGPIEKDATSGQ